MAPKTRKAKPIVVANKQKRPVHTRRTSVPLDLTRLKVFYREGKFREDGVERIRSILHGSRPVPPRIKKSLMKTLTVLTSQNVGPADMHDDVMTIASAPRDIPPVPLLNYQFLERKVRIVKKAGSGTTAGGFYAELIASDFGPYTFNYFRIKRITSWSAPINSATESQYASVSTPAATATDGTEALPSWTEDFTRIGEGFSGIDIMYPLGDFLLYPDLATTVIATHFTGLGGAGGLTGVPVVFDVIAEVLI